MTSRRPPLLDNVKCVHCGYLLRTLDTASKCPECGRPVADSLSTWDEAKLLKREEHVHARMDLYRRNRSAAVALAGFSLVGSVFMLVVMSFLGEGDSAVGLLVATGFYAAAFWAAVAFANRYRYEHAQSIERFRMREFIRKQASDRGDTPKGAPVAGEAPTCDVQQ